MTIPEKGDRESTLREQLARLQAELAVKRQLAPADRELAQHLSDELRTVLADEKPHPVRYQSLLERIREAMERFEAAHPSLTTAMERTIDQLAQLNL